MRGEWFDTVSNCITFSITAKATKETEVTAFRHAIVRLMSLAHGAALEEIADNQIQVDTIDILGLNEETLKHIKDCKENWKFNKVEVILHLVQSLITKAHDDGVLKVPPPILSRVYQTISRGFVNQLNAKKITDTRFPFPYAQLMSAMLFIVVLMCPLIVTSVLASKVLAAIVTFIPIYGMTSLNLIAAELENPFGTDSNDLPLEHFQSEMNNCLLMLLHPGTDTVPSVRTDCLTDFFYFVQRYVCRRRRTWSTRRR
jgi:predicted membrane chloride channel (bestrophin family)